MPLRKSEEDGWDDGGRDWDGAAGAWEADDDEATIPCPYCRRQIHEDAQRCPYCEKYISAEDGPPALKPWWFIIGILLTLYVVYLWITR